jgi:methanogenic corrinoid protein MtbC1
MKTWTPRKKRPAHDAFPLRTVAAMTGLTPDLVRAWERRYGVVAPIRGARGARLYTSADIRHLRLLARVVAGGRAIGDVAALSRAELEKLAASSAADAHEGERRTAGAPKEGFIARVLEHLAAFDYGTVLGLLGDAVVGLGARNFVHEVALPLVRQVGRRWAEGELSVAEEHLLSGILRNLLAGMVQTRRAAGRPVLLATPAGEQHELGLLMVAVLALDAGANAIYLGMDLPAAEIAEAAVRMQARVVGLSIVAAKNRKRATEEVSALAAALKGQSELWLGGADAANAAAGAGAFGGTVCDSLQAAETELARIVAEAPRHMRLVRSTHGPRSPQRNRRARSRRPLRPQR